MQNAEIHDMLPFGLWTTPIGSHTIDVLTHWLCRKFSPHTLAQTTLLMPSLESATLLRANLQQHMPQALLLPRLYTLGHLSPAVHDIVPEKGLALATNNKGTLPPLKRHIMLIKKLRDALNAPAWTYDTFWHLAQEACLLLDSAVMEEVSLDTCINTIPPQLLEKWDQLKAFLHTLGHGWPAFLKDNALIESSTQEHIACTFLTDFFKIGTWPHPVIIAGSTGSVPRIHRLMQAVLELPRGCVLLPGYEHEVHVQSNTSMPPTHPQAALKHWTNIKIQTAHTLSITHENSVRKRNTHQAERGYLVQTAFTTTATHAFDKQAAVAGLRYFKANNKHQEGLAIALAIRHALNTPKQTVAVLIPHPSLEKIIRQHLAQWRLAPNPLPTTCMLETPAGIALHTLLNIAQQFPTALKGHTLSPAFLTHVLGLLHTLSDNSSVQSTASSNTSQRLSDALHTVLWQIFKKDICHPKTPFCLPPSKPWQHLPSHPFQNRRRLALKLLWYAFDPLVAHAHSRTRLATWIKHVLLVLQRLTRQRFTTQQAATAPAWQDLIAFLNTLADTANVLGDVSLEDAVTLITNACGTENVTAQKAVKLQNKELQDNGLHKEALQQDIPHPASQRITLLGSHEGRFVGADLVIMAGLNEGLWPQTPPANPWISRGMKKEMNLCDADRRQSLAAHDFCEALKNNTCVLLTLSENSAGAPEAPSPFLRRIERALGGPLPSDMTLQRHLDDWCTYMPNAHICNNENGYFPVTCHTSCTHLTQRPRPKPPLDARPKTYSASALRLLQNNPYFYYARYILGLNPMPPAGGELSPALFGTTMHSLMEQLTALPRDQRHLDKASELLEAVLQPWLHLPDVRFFWHAHGMGFLPSVLKVLANFPSQARFFSEIQGRMHVAPSKANRIALTARADAVVVQPDKGATIIDYKTGTPPAPSNVLSGSEPQMPLEGALWLAKGFRGIPKNLKDHPLHALAWWHLSRTGLKVNTLQDPEKAAQNVLEHLKQLLEAFTVHGAPYEARPLLAEPLSYEAPYTHLARNQAWQR